MDPRHNSTTDLSESVLLLKKEVDALQIAVMSQKTSWYKNPATIISILALLFSFGTTAVSYVRTYEQDKQNRRAELRGLLERLSNISKETVEIPKKYPNDPVTIGLLSGNLNQENALLSRQAAEIAKKLPKDSVSATEYYFIGWALQSSYNLQGAKEFYGYAIGAATDFNDKIAALRANAILLFNTGQAEAGRNEYRKALEIFSTFPGYDDYTKKTTNILTEINWAFSEATLGLKAQANQHLVTAETYASTLSPSPGADQMKGQIENAKRQINGATTPINQWSAEGLPKLPEAIK